MLSYYYLNQYKKEMKAFESLEEAKKAIIEGLPKDGVVKFIAPKSQLEWESKVIQCLVVCKILRTLNNNFFEGRKEYNFFEKKQPFYFTTTFKIVYDSANYCFKVYHGLTSSDGRKEFYNELINLNRVTEEMTERLISEMKLKIPKTHADRILDLYNRIKETTKISAMVSNYSSNLLDYKEEVVPILQDSGSYIDRDLVKPTLQDYSSAIQECNRALMINPQDAMAYFNRGTVKTCLNDFNSAIQDFNKAIEINPRFTGAYFNRGMAKGFLQDHTGALQDYSKVIEIDPQNADAYSNRGKEKSAYLEFNSALEDFNKAIGINPYDSDTYYCRGGAKHVLGDNDGACKDWRKAGELGLMSAYELIKVYCK